MFGRGDGETPLRWTLQLQSMSERRGGKSGQRWVVPLKQLTQSACGTFLVRFSSTQMHLARLGVLNANTVFVTHKFINQFLVLVESSSRLALSMQLRRCWWPLQRYPVLLRTSHENAASQGKQISLNQLPALLELPFLAAKRVFAFLAASINIATRNRNRPPLLDRCFLTQEYSLLVPTLFYIHEECQQEETQ